jgi:hypothetical protein
VRFFLISLLPLLLCADPVSATLQEVRDNEATVKIEWAEPGLSGVILRHFNKEHSSIIANALVTAFDEQKHTARLRYTPYDGLRQNALPKGLWKPQKGDEFIVAPDYSRALMIAPNAIVYDRITDAFKSLNWIHPDRFAAHLSISGNPAPSAEEFTEFCTENNVGLLYIHLESSLFTLDCKSMSLLQISEAAIPSDDIKLPFYSRVETIREAFWGIGNDSVETYAPHYLKLIEASNAGHPALKTFYGASGRAPACDSWFDSLTHFFGAVGCDVQNEETEKE